MYPGFQCSLLRRAEAEACIQEWGLHVWADVKSVTEWQRPLPLQGCAIPCVLLCTSFTCLPGWDDTQRLSNGAIMPGVAV